MKLKLHQHFHRLLNGYTYLKGLERVTALIRGERNYLFFNRGFFFFPFSFVLVTSFLFPFFF